MPQMILRTHTPSPSTTCYTVSSAPSLASPAPKLLHLVNLSLRAVVAAIAIVLSAIQLRLSSRFPDPLGMEARVSKLILNALGPQFTSDGTWWWMLLIVAGTIMWACSRRSSVQESLLIIRGLGIQTSTSSSSYLSTPTTRFIPTAQVQDIFIHEAFIGFSVKFYLAVIVEGEEEAVVVFPKLLPRRDVLEEVWRGARGVLGWSKE